MDLGKNINRLRKAAGLTLNELASKTGLSVAYLSNVERNATSPTIINLEKIAAVFSIPLVKLFEESADTYVVRRDNHEMLFENEGKYKLESTIIKNDSIVGELLTIYEDNFEEEVTNGHPGRSEFGYVIKGTMSFEVAGVRYILEEGDTIFIPAGTPHRYHKVNEGECLSHWVNFSPKM